MHVWSNALVQVITVHRDVQTACEDRMPPNLFQNAAQSLGQENSSALYSNEDQVFVGFTSLSNLMSNPSQCPFHTLGIENLGRFCHLGRQLKSTGILGKKKAIEA